MAAISDKREAVVFKETYITLRHLLRDGAAWAEVLAWAGFGFESRAISAPRLSRMPQYT